MKAISDNFTPVEATLNCIAAGVDLILMPIRLWSKENILEFRKYMTDLIYSMSKFGVVKNSVSLNHVVELLS